MNAEPKPEPQSEGPILVTVGYGVDTTLHTPMTHVNLWVPFLLSSSSLLPLSSIFILFILWTSSPYMHIYINTRTGGSPSLVVLNMICLAAGVCYNFSPLKPHLNGGLSEFCFGSFFI